MKKIQLKLMLLFKHTKALFRGKSQKEMMCIITITHYSSLIAIKVPQTTVTVSAEHPSVKFTEKHTFTQS